MEEIAFGCDHAGHSLKAAIVEILQARGFKVLDFGTSSADLVDYPDFASRVCESILNQQAVQGVLICGTGIGMSIAANRYKGIRAALCTSVQQTELARRHNDANVLCLGARITDNETAIACLTTFLSTPFEGERHAVRIAKLDV